jgi:hypothetical protein
MNRELKDRIRIQFDIELNNFAKVQNSVERWKQLERLHIIGQLLIKSHYRVHFLMLRLAINERK